jgi:hypothetical protein
MMRNQGVKRVMMKNLQAKGKTKVNLQEGKKIRMTLTATKGLLVKSSGKLEMEHSI